jgi:histidyl-tRNA synthetase
MLAKARRFQVYKAPRGTTDILPQEQAYWRFVEEKAGQICQLYGYQRIDTPVFEQTGLFYHSVGEGTDIVEKQMYTFEDHSGMKMTLRPEGTAPVCRAYIEHGMHSLPQPVRLYYFGPIFRYERPQAGRYRQHQQFGCEAIGNADPAVDAEVIDMAWHLYASLELKRLTLQLNSIGCRNCRPGYLQSLKQYYTSLSQSLCRDCKARLWRNPLRLLDCKKPSCLEIAKGAPQMLGFLCHECSSHFDALKDCLRYLEIPYEINPYLVRGLDYYTRTVFEIQPEGGGAQSTLGGGGRYDNLIEELGGRPTPAIGFATGIERIILNVRKQGIELLPMPGVKVYVAYLGEEAKEEAIKLVATLRQAGVGATLALGGRSLKAQLKQANALRVPQAIIIGDEEIKRGSVVLRDMMKGEQVELPLGEVVMQFRRRIHQPRQVK